MGAREFSSLLISDFNIDNLAGCLRSDTDSPPVKSTVAPFDQVVQVLMDSTLECWKAKPDLAVVWTQPQGVIESFAQILNYRRVSIEAVIQQVDRYCLLLAGICDRVRFVFVPTWVSPSYNRGLGMLNMRTDIGISSALMQMNLRLCANLDNVPGVYLLDAQRWTGIAGRSASNPKLWYMGKIAFGRDVFVEAAKDIKAAIRGLTGSSKKLLILDLDDTLWGGILGDVGWENLTLGGHDAIGEAYVDFQRSLKSLTNRGILLAIVSKNEESLALEAIKSHPEMVLRPDDFAGWRINWEDKAKNIVELASDLNLGLDSAVFIDDNPVERARVSQALPSVLVPEWPKDKMLYASTLLGLHCFDTPSISGEDVQRTQMYVSERQRKESRASTGSLDEWLKSLDTEVRVEELNTTNLQRAAQLLNRTNQMNLRTRRLTESELSDWAGKENRKILTFSVQDRFGSSGLTGLLSLEVAGSTGSIVDFVLSCRVMGRKVEEAMLHAAIECARSMGVEEVCAEFLPTAKNNPCLEFWKRSGFACDQQDWWFRWQVKDGYPLPDCIRIQ